LETYRTEHTALVRYLQNKGEDVEDLYICGISYKDPRDGSKIGDIQMTITGGCDAADAADAYKVAHKELREEIGLEVMDESSDIVDIECEKNHVFVIRADRCQLYDATGSAEKYAYAMGSGRVKKRKVVVALVGTLAKLAELLGQSRNRSHVKNAEDMANIDGAILTKFADFAELYSTMATSTVATSTVATSTVAIKPLDGGRRKRNYR
jgi:hypothetical protein